MGSYADWVALKVLTNEPHLVDEIIDLVLVCSFFFPGDVFVLLTGKDCVTGFCLVNQCWNLALSDFFLTAELIKLMDLCFQSIPTYCENRIEVAESQQINQYDIHGLNDPTVELSFDVCCYF